MFVPRCTLTANYVLKTQFILTVIMYIYHRDYTKRTSVSVVHTCIKWTGLHDLNKKIHTKIFFFATVLVIKKEQAEDSIMRHLCDGDTFLLNVHPTSCSLVCIVINIIV